MVFPAHSAGEDESPVPTSSFAGAKLAPSEAVLLYGDKFTSGIGHPRSRQEKLLRINRSVSAAGLSRAAWLAALLSIEAAGTIRFEIHPNISRLPKRDKAVYISRLDPQARWPLGSLEKKICGKLREGTWTPCNLVYALLEQHGSHARYDTLGLIKQGLLERGLLTVRASRRFGVIRSSRYKLVQRTLTMVPEHGLEELTGLLLDTDARRIALLKELRAQIDRALARARYLWAKHAATAIAELAGDFAGFFH